MDQIMSLEAPEAVATVRKGMHDLFDVPIDDELTRKR